MLECLARSTIDSKAAAKNSAGPGAPSVAKRFTEDDMDAELELQRNDFKISFLSKQQQIVASQSDNKGSHDNVSNENTLANLVDQSDDSVYESTY